MCIEDQKIKVSKLLKSLGQSTFLKYYYVFKEGGDINFEEDYTKSSINTKVYSGRKIFNENLQLLALTLLSQSNKSEIIDKAKEILKKEQELTIEKTLIFSNQQASNFSSLNDEELIKLYGDLTSQLKNRKIVRSKRITGDLGERAAVNYYSSKGKKLKLASENTKDYDASYKGKRYQIKTVTQYETGSISGVTTKDNKLFDYLLIVQLDDNYKMIQLYELTWDQFFTHKTLKRLETNSYCIKLKKEIKEKFGVFIKYLPKKLTI